MDNERILYIINSPKIITKQPKKKTSLINGSYRNDFEVALIADKNVKLNVHFRKNEKFSENFSIILEYNNQELQKRIILLRYNGAHGYHKNKIIDDNEFESFHIHRATNEAIKQGYNPECWAYATKDYTTFEEAATKFWQDIKIQDDIDKFFKDYKAVQLFLFNN